MVISRGNPIPYGSWIIVNVWKSGVAHAHELIFKIRNALGPRCRRTLYGVEGRQSCPVGIIYA